MGVNFPSKFLSKFSSTYHMYLLYCILKRYERYVEKITGSLHCVRDDAKRLSAYRVLPHTPLRSYGVTEVSPLRG